MRRTFSPLAALQCQAPNPAILLTVIVPTYNERPNVRALVNSLAAVLSHVTYEVIFVDDNSPDGTADEVRTLGISDPAIRVIQRIGRRGLASACLEGMLASSAPYIAVIDADMQHDEAILPEMLRRLRDEPLDLVVGSRHVPGGSMGQFSKRRVLMSQLGRKLSSLITHCDLTDPMSGYFALNRKFLDEVIHSVSAIGFKILIDLIASAPRPVRFAEVPYVFRLRQHERSKMDARAGLEFLYLLGEKLIGHAIPVQAILLAFLLLAGMAIYLAALLFCLQAARFPLIPAVLFVSFAAVLCQFIAENAFTFRNRRVGGLRYWRDASAFALVATPGILANAAVVRLLTHSHVRVSLSFSIGFLLLAFWTAAASSLLRWRKYR